MFVSDLVEIFSLPRVTIHLMYEKSADNDPFYRAIVERYYREATQRHPKFLFAQKFEYGFSLCELPKEFDAYFMAIEASARRNAKKALRMGYQMRRFDFNSQLDGVRQILVSTPIRQGKLLPEDIRKGQVHEVNDPPSRNSYHDYPYFGIFKEEKLVAYAGCMVVGELCNLNDIYGHADYQADGVVPLLIIEIVRELMISFRHVNFYSYGMYYGASETMRRFKKKFLFYPHHVKWILQ